MPTITPELREAFEKDFEYHGNGAYARLNVPMYDEDDVQTGTTKSYMVPADILSFVAEREALAEKRIVEEMQNEAMQSPKNTATLHEAYAEIDRLWNILFPKKASETGVIKNGVKEDLVVVLDFVERWNKKDTDVKVANAAQNLQASLTQTSNTDL